MRIFLIKIIFLLFPIISLSDLFAEESDPGFKELLESARSGDLGAIKLVSEHYHYKGNLEEKIFWLKKGAEKGDSPSMFHLGEVYLSRREYKNSIEWLEKAVEHRNFFAAHLLSEFYDGLFENFTERSAEKRISYLEKAASFGHPVANKDLADIYKEENDYKNTLKYLREQVNVEYVTKYEDEIDYPYADRESCASWNRMGDYTYNLNKEILFRDLNNKEIYLDKTMKEARNIYLLWLKDLSKKGNPLVKNYLASIYFSDPELLNSDSGESLLLELVSAQAENSYKENASVEASLRLSKMYLSPDSSKKNIPKGIEYLKKAISTNDLEAITLLSYFYYTGLYLEKDILQAKKIMDNFSYDYEKSYEFYIYSSYLKNLLSYKTSKPDEREEYLKNFIGLAKSDMDLLSMIWLLNYYKDLSVSEKKDYKEEVKKYIDMIKIWKKYYYRNICNFERQNPDDNTGEEFLFSTEDKQINELHCIAFKGLLSEFGINDLDLYFERL
ncbi:MAG TPA: hypothetical protein PKA63_12145 [Oligoflexia bacterium]|nr:hypothetical protein [Oligoflexia bacterium]HMP49406.1 hypothetical protein [Oligoflexia bacterium]